MVGKEPDLNQLEDWEMIRDGTPAEKLSISRRLLALRPCDTHKAEDDSKKPYHLWTPGCEDYRANLTTPLIQVFSVSISTNFDDGKPCEIHGFIRALEDDYHRFDLYDRAPEDSETILKQGTLSLTGPEGGALIPCFCVTLKLCLKDRIRGVEVVEGSIILDPYWNPWTEDSYDKLLKGDVHGTHGCASVYYVVFQYAQYAKIWVGITENENEPLCENSYDVKRGVADIYGSVVARYNNGARYCNGDEESKLLETRVFDKPAHQPLRVVVGTPFQLSRDMVVAPAYSTLLLEVNLWDSNGKIVGEHLSIPGHIGGDHIFHIPIQNAYVRVRVHWRHAYTYIYKERYYLKPESSNSPKEMNKKARESYDEQPLSSLEPRVYFGRGEERVEVHSVFVDGRFNKKISTLCGAIIIDNGAEKFSIYNRDDGDAELLADDGLASIEVNYKAIETGQLRMSLYLRDPTSNLEVSRGHMAWNIFTLRSYVKYHNKRLCSLVQGDDGFAAVYYEMFSESYIASLKVKLVVDGQSKSLDIPVNLYGSLFARYNDDEYDYSTSYEKKFRSRLFYRSRDRYVELKSGSRINVLKSLVVVPVYTSLVIEANLGVVGIGGAGDETICDIAVFPIDTDKPGFAKIGGEDYWIEVTVEFEA